MWQVLSSAQAVFRSAQGDTQSPPWTRRLLRAGRREHEPSGPDLDGVSRAGTGGAGCDPGAVLRPAGFLAGLRLRLDGFPSVGLLVRGLAGLSATALEHRIEPASAGSRERELLEALREHGELTPTRAAMETSLSVGEADQMLKDLAAAGHLEVRTRGVGLSYALWASPTAQEGRYLEARTSVGEKGAT